MWCLITRKSLYNYIIIKVTTAIHQRLQSFKIISASFNVISETPSLPRMLNKQISPPPTFILFTIRRRLCTSAVRIPIQEGTVTTVHSYKPIIYAA